MTIKSSSRINSLLHLPFWILFIFGERGRISTGAEATLSHTKLEVGLTFPRTIYTINVI